MSSFQSVYTFNDMVSAIQTIGRGGQLSFSQENALSALNSAAQNFPSLERCCQELGLLVTYPLTGFSFVRQQRF